MWHFHVGVKFLYLVEYGVFVIIFKIVITLLHETGVMNGERGRNVSDKRAFGFGAELTIALSWPRVIESKSLLWKVKDNLLSKMRQLYARGTDHDRG